MISNAFDILSNYSFGFYNFVDLIDESVSFLNIYSTNVMLGEQHDSSYWIRFLEYLQDEYSIMLIADVITLEHDDFMQGVDEETYHFGLAEEIRSFQLGITHEQRAERYRRVDHPTVWERVFDAWNIKYTKLYLLGFDNTEPGDDDFEFEDVDEYVPGNDDVVANNFNGVDPFAVFNTFDEKPHFAQVNHTLINEAIGKRAHKQVFQSQISEELIAEAMHPHRMMARMQMFEDIEEFFECC